MQAYDSLESVPMSVSFLVKQIKKEKGGSLGAVFE